MAGGYNEYLASDAQHDRLEVVLVSPRNPLNSGAAARAMANFGFSRLTVVAPYAPIWREARSAVGAPQLLREARETATLAEAVADCTLVLGTGSLTYRKPEQPVVKLPELASLVRRELERGGRIAVVFGPEKHGLTREDLAFCHVLVEIPTDTLQPSMNLGQAVAVCLYELSVRAFSELAVRAFTELTVQALAPQESAPETTEFPEQAIRPLISNAVSHPCAEKKAQGWGTESFGSQESESDRERATTEPAAPSGTLDLLVGLIEETMQAAGYSPRSMQAANRHDLRLLVRRLALSPHDARRFLGLFRRILWRLNKRVPRPHDVSPRSHP